MKYRKIEPLLGSSIESVIEELKSHVGLVYCEFNGKILYSDIDDVDSAYKKVTGMTKAECDEKKRIYQEKRKEEQLKHEESIPRLTEEWIAKGKSILDSEYHESWTHAVPIRLSDLYRGMELESTINIVKELNKGCELNEAKAIIESQNHSGMSFSLVISMVKSFCKRGSEFADYVH